MDMEPPQDQGPCRGPELLVVGLVPGVDVDVIGAPTDQDEAVQGMDMEPPQDQGPCRGPEPLVVGLVSGEAVDVSGAQGVEQPVDQPQFSGTKVPDGEPGVVSSTIREDASQEGLESGGGMFNGQGERPTAQPACPGSFQNDEKPMDVVEGVDKVVVKAPSSEFKLPEFQCTFISTAELAETFKGVPGEDFGMTDVAGPSEPAVPADGREIYVPRSNLDHHPFLFHSTEPLQCMEVVPENLTCTMDCGEPMPEQGFVTVDLQLNKKLFRNVFKERKYVLDYVFNKSEAWLKG
ncbi:uncharacterized protein LOC141621427 [Silene latifolia]|uniref:uncharacterized protein LOC141621427 n=1 Tax=Silene latifolia TaxID=37657 RepID=UPI003D786099